MLLKVVATWLQTALSLTHLHIEIPNLYVHTDEHNALVAVVRVVAARAEQHQPCKRVSVSHLATPDLKHASIGRRMGGGICGVHGA